MLVGTLIAVMIAVVVGVNLIPIIMDTVNIAAEEGVIEEGTTVATLVGVLPYIFVAVILIGAVAWIGGGIGGSDEEKSERKERVKQFFGNAKEVILRIEESSKNWSQYLNNLDGLLGIRTVVAKDNRNVPGVVKLNGLYLTPGKELWIDKSYDWYLADKHPDKDIFKVVGLHKKDASRNLVYLLGINLERNKPYLSEVPAETYLEAGCKQCLDWLETSKVTVEA